MATLKELKRAAREFNEVMDGLDPLINVNLPEKELTDILKQAITFIDPEQDHFTDQTQAIIDELSDLEEPAEEEELSQQETAEKIHKQNIADKPVKVGDEEPLTPSGRKQVPIPVKKEKKEKVEKKELFAKKASTTADRIAFISPFIEKGKFTKKQLVEKLTDKFPDLAVSSISTLLTDAKNPKYNKFPKLVIQDDKGYLSFKEE
jgi:hypothetical protein